MSVNPYTLNNLYNQGIIDYGAQGFNMLGGMPPMCGDAYMSLALDGALYKGYGAYNDTFRYKNAGVMNSAYYPMTNTLPSKAKMHSPNVFFDGIGNVFGINNNMSAADYKVVGSDESNIMQKKNKYSNILTFVKGVLSGAIVLGTVAFLFKGKKVPKK